MASEGMVWLLHRTNGLHPGSEDALGRTPLTVAEGD